MEQICRSLIQVINMKVIRCLGIQQSEQIDRYMYSWTVSQFHRL